MPGFVSQDWFALGVGYSTVAAGLVLLLVALFRDRSHGHRRCPKCWYNMDGLAPHAVEHREIWKCPECGREQLHLRRLLKTRRHWLAVSVSFFLMAAGFLAIKWPAMRQGGWTAAVPDLVLIYAVDPAATLGSSFPSGRSEDYRERLSWELKRRLGQRSENAWGFGDFGFPSAERSMPRWCAWLWVSRMTRYLSSPVANQPTCQAPVRTYSMKHLLDCIERHDPRASIYYSMDAENGILRLMRSKFPRPARSGGASVVFVSPWVIVKADESVHANIAALLADLQRQAHATPPCTDAPDDNVARMPPWLDPNPNL